METNVKVAQKIFKKCQLSTNYNVMTISAQCVRVRLCMSEQLRAVGIIHWNEVYKHYVSTL